MKIRRLLWLMMLLILVTSFSYNIVTSIKPLYLIIKDEVGNSCNVSYLVNPYLNPHTFQLKPSDMVKLENADLIVLVGNNFESWSDKIYQKFSKKVLIMKKTILKSIITRNPHFWIDPIYVNCFSDLIFSKLDKKLQQQSMNSYLKFKFSLLNEEEKILKMSENVKNPFFLAVHPAFFYLITRYGFEVRSLISGGESSITPKDLIELIKYSKKHKITKIFAVEGLNSSLARPLISSAKLKMINIDFLGKNSSNYITYLNKIAEHIFGENQ